MAKLILGIIAGIVTCGLVIFAIEWIAGQLFPGAAEAATRGDLSGVPIGALIGVLFGWFVGPLLGGYLAVRVAERSWTAWPIAAFVILGVILNATMIPHPLWMVALGLLLPVAAGWLASRSVRPAAGAGA